jgi:uncharacterized protein (TIGR03067 family)
VHEFLPDGEYVFSQGGKTARGAWQRDGTKVSFQAKSGDGQLAIDKWLVVVSRRGDQLDVRLEGDRPYSWRAIKTENDGNGGRASSTLTALQGNWKAIQLWANGKQNTNPDFWREPKTLSVQGKNFTLVLIDGTFRGTLDADGSDDPPQITFKPVDRNGMELRGVYQANGDELTICWVIYHKAMGREPQRPTTLEPAQGVMKFVFRR